jgi:hypothetical protein
MTALSGEMQIFTESGQSLLQYRDARIVVLLCVLVGFLPASQRYLLRSTQTNLRALEPLLPDAVDPVDSLELPRPSFWRCILPGILLLPAIAYAIDRDLSFYLQPEYYRLPIHWFQWGVGIYCTVNAALATHLSLACATEIAKRGNETLHIDLFDLAPLSPFARQSMQTLLVWLLMLSIFSVNAADSDFLLPLLAITAICLGNSVLAVVRCNRGVHRRILQAKRDELLRVNAALRGDESVQAGLSLGARGPSGAFSPADLLAYRSFVDGSREWALDSSAWLRSAFYLAIPLGSWLGGAIVERVLEASLR